MGASASQARIRLGWGKFVRVSQRKDLIPAWEGVKEEEEEEGEEDKLQITSQTQGAPRLNLGNQQERSGVTGH